MENSYFSNTQALLDDLSEGILVYHSEDKAIANNHFMHIFGIKNNDSNTIIAELNKYGLKEMLIDDSCIEKDIQVKDKKIKVQKSKLHFSDEHIFQILIFKELINGNKDSKIKELMRSLDAMKDIVDNAYQGMVLVDKDGRVLKWCYEKLFGIKEEDVLGKHVDEAIENTRLHVVVKTGQKELCDIQRIQGRDMLANRIPIIEDGVVIGAIGTVLFRDIEEIRAITKKVEMLEKTVNKYKNEISKMYSAKYTFENIITQNVDMIELKEFAARVANSDSTVLIQGDSGTGKEFFAHAIHNASGRRYAPFVQINCAAIPHELLESELFGYEGGAFTGAKKEGKIGKLELANGGTVLMDEIVSMPLSMQAKLLRVLEEREFERIGGNTKIKIDVRIIACTNVNLKTAVKQGRFRNDLFYRLNVVEINIPPLKERIDDIPVLCDEILSQLVRNMGFTHKTITDRAMEALKLYSWPGNVRELRNVLERAANMSSGNLITLEDLPDYIKNNVKDKVLKVDKSCLKTRVIDTELDAIIEALKKSNGNRTEAAKLLGIHRTALYKKIKKYGINIKNI